MQSVHRVDEHGARHGRSRRRRFFRQLLAPAYRSRVQAVFLPARNLVDYWGFKRARGRAVDGADSPADERRTGGSEGVESDVLVSGSS